MSSVPVDSDLLDRAFELYYVEIKAAVRRCGHSTAAAAEIVHELYVKLAAHPGLLPERSLRVSLCRAAMYLGFKRLGRVPPACSDTACATSPEDRQVLLAIEESDPHSLAPRDREAVADGRVFQPVSWILSSRLKGADKCCSLCSLKVSLINLPIQ